MSWGSRLLPTNGACYSPCWCEQQRSDFSKWIFAWLQALVLPCWLSAMRCAKKSVSNHKQVLPAGKEEGEPDTKPAPNNPPPQRWSHPLASKTYPVFVRVCICRFSCICISLYVCEHIYVAGCFPITPSPTPLIFPHSAVCHTAPT